MGVHDTDEFPWLETERRWITDAVGSGVPVLGVCLGAQLLAAALGASVTTGPSPEIGVGEVELTAEGRADPVLGPEGDRVAGHPLARRHLRDPRRRRPPGDGVTATRTRPSATAVGSTGCSSTSRWTTQMAEAWAPELPAGRQPRPPRIAAAVEEVGRRVLGGSSRWPAATVAAGSCGRSCAGAHTQRRSSSACSVTRAQVGQYQRASRGVPHERWCGPSTSPPASRAPHRLSSRNAPARSRPASVTRYSTRGGRSE